MKKQAGKWLVVLRHGDYYTDGELSGQLSDEGKSQAKKVAFVIADVVPYAKTAIITSPVPRATEFAKEVAAFFSPIQPIELQGLFHEEAILEPGVVALLVDLSDSYLQQYDVLFVVSHMAPVLQLSRRAVELLNDGRSNGLLYKTPEKGSGFIINLGDGSFKLCP